MRSSCFKFLGNEIWFVVSCDSHCPAIDRQELRDRAPCFSWKEGWTVVFGSDPSSLLCTVIRAYNLDAVERAGKSYLSNIAPRQTSSKGPWPFLAASLSFSYSPSAPLHPLLPMQRGPIDILRNQQPRAESIKIALLYLPFHQIVLPFHQIFLPYHQSALLYPLIHLEARSSQLCHQVTLP